MGGKVIKGSRKVLEWAGLPSPAPLLAQAWVPRSHFPPKERAINLWHWEILTWIGWIQAREMKQSKIQTGKCNKTQIKPMIKSHSASPHGFYFLQIRTTLILHAYSPASFVIMTWLCYLEVLCQHFNQANSFADNANIYPTVCAVNNDYYLKINHTKHNCQWTHFHTFFIFVLIQSILLMF